MCTRKHTRTHSHTGGVIRIRGRNLAENEHVKMGAYHTLELEPQRPFTVRGRALVKGLRDMGQGRR